MREFQGSLGPVQELQPKRRREDLEPQKADGSSKFGAIARSALALIGFAGAVAVFYLGIYAFGALLYRVVTGLWL